MTDPQPNRKARRRAMATYNKDRKAAIKSIRAVPDPKNRVEYALSFARRLEALWPYFNPAKFLRDCGLIEADTGMWSLPGHPNSVSSAQETPS